jgi:hypothetical protein
LATRDLPVDKFSNTVELKAGTPQGSVLSPTLYIIFVNDTPLSDILNKVRAGQFADDISAWTSSTSLCRNYLHLQNRLDEIEEWCSRWRVKVNVGKSQLINFSNKRIRKHNNRDIQLSLFDMPIAPVSKIIFLGNTLDKMLTMTEHCRGRALTASRRTNLLKMIAGSGWGANQRSLMILYKQYIRPVLEHGYPTTADGPTKLASGILSRAERKALRVVTRSPYGTSNEELYRRSGITPLLERMKMLKSNASTTTTAAQIYLELRNQ